MLYPGFDDPLAVTLGVSKLVHEYSTAEECVQYLRGQRGLNMDALTGKLLAEDSDAPPKK